MKITAHSAVEVGQRVKFTSRAADELGGASSSYRGYLSDKRGTVTDIPSPHVALVLWDGHEDAARVMRHYLEPVWCEVMKYKIEVTQEDIDKGERDDCTRCALALAIRRATGRALNVYGVGSSAPAGVYLGIAPEGLDPKYDHKLVADLPRVAAEFAAAFDDSHECDPDTCFPYPCKFDRGALRPFSFEIETLE